MFDILKRNIIAMATTLQGAVPKEDIINQLCYRIDSDGSMDLGVFGALPAMKEVGKSGIDAESIAEYNFAIKNRDRAARVTVHKRDLARDARKGGNLRRHLASIANAPLRADRKDIVTLMTSGTSLPTGGDTTFDGIAFFSASHKYAKSKYTTTQSNLISTAIVNKDAPTQAELEAAIDAIRTKFNTFKDDQGEIFHDNGQSGLVVVCPDSMRSAFEDILTVKTTDNGGDNKYYQMLGLHVEPRLTATDAFYVFKMDGGEAKPFIKQNEDLGGGMYEVEISAPDSDFVQDTNKHKITIKDNGRMGYFMWQFAVKQVFTTA